MQLQMHMVTIEDLVPQGHFLRKLKSVLDLTFVREETAHLYNRRLGRPPIDPVVLVKYLLVGYLYGIPSERQIEQRIQTDVALRWYLGIDLLERVPDHSTISQLRRRKPAFRKVFRRLFERVVNQCIEEGLVSGRLVLTDSTHVKANASRASEEQIEMPESPGAYWKRLDTYEEEGLEELKRRTGKRREKRTRQIKKDSRRTKKRVSRTDPEAGHRYGQRSSIHFLVPDKSIPYAPPPFIFRRLAFEIVHMPVFSPLSHRSAPVGPGPCPGTGIFPQIQRGCSDPPASRLGSPRGLWRGPGLLYPPRGQG